MLWRHTTTGQMWLWPMNGATKRSETFVATVPVEYAIVGTADHSGDGKADLLWRRTVNGEVWIWLMNGATPLSKTWVATIPTDYGVVGSGAAG